ncbi:MAG: transposase [Sedimentisphaerales bacterium]|nr:transposase [Sedimentisphaerales bacterium]
MTKTIGYMITWTTYGTWLQGRKQGFVKDGRVRGENIAIKKDCENKLESRPVQFGRNERDIVRDAILEAAKRFQQKMRAIAVRSNHVHIVAEYVEVPMGILVGHYKSAGRIALKEWGFEGKVWTRGYDKRFCFSEKELRARVDYVNKHRESGIICGPATARPRIRL